MLSFLLFLSFHFVKFGTSFNFTLDELWNSYKMVFGKLYNSTEEEIKRRLIWEENYKLVHNHNKVEEDSNKHGFKLGINHLSDMNTQEYLMFNGLRVENISESSTVYSPPPNYKYPKSIDWRQKGLVTKVKNQGRCGACWAFSAVGALEGQHKKKTGKLHSLSAQNLIDCFDYGVNHGCSGGLVDPAFKFIKENGGIEMEKYYPYAGRNQSCKFEKNKIAATVKSWVDIPHYDEDTLMKAVANIGPISAGINAHCYGFKHYKSGIYEAKKCNPKTLTHAILIVGYGRKNGTDYWIVKNSWGSKWGEDGYVKIRRNKKNQCGIASLASFPVV